VLAQGILGWSPNSASALPLDFRLQLAGVPFADMLHAARSPAVGDGRLEGGLRITGTTLAPLIEANLTTTGLVYDEVRLGRGFFELNYADGAGDVFLEAQQGRKSVLSGGGQVPYDLRFTTVAQRRPDRPLAFSIVADSLPAAQVLAFFNGFRRVEGWLQDTIRVGGTTANPALSGKLTARRLAATWSATGVRYTDLNGEFRLISGRVVQVDARTRTQDPRGDGPSGTGTVTGTLDFARLSNPSFDLNLRVDRVVAAQRRDVEAVMTGDIHLGGRYAAPDITATLRVDRGVMYLDELYRQFFVVQLDSASMFQFVDTSLVAGRRVLPVARNPFLDNLRIHDTRISIGTGSWLRSQDMDVEVQGDVTVAFDRRADDLRLSGRLDVVRGSYQLVYPPLQARRFRVTDGTIDFTGLPGLDPNLLITAVYKGRAGNEPLDIVAQVSGSLQNPRVRLTSDEEPPISESDLASYLFFGVPTWEMGTLVGVQSGDNRGTLTGLSRTVAPSLLGYASSGLQTLAQGAGLLDYVSLTAEALPGTEGASRRNGFLAGAQLELGRYITPNLYLGLSQRLAESTGRPGVRLEWRFRPTATLELFSEEQFARSAAGLGFNQEAFMRKPVYGFFLFREWGY
jgi:autotransporter translocation and assembly factor TamB